MQLDGTEIARERPLVYVVDDQPDISEVISLGLELAGYRAEVFSDPEAALAAFTSAKAKPVLLVSDYNMPGMNGMELLQRCKRLDPGLKTISLSGTLCADIRGTYEIQPDVALPKPVRLADFLQVVGGLMGRKNEV